MRKRIAVAAIVAVLVVVFVVYNITVLSWG